MYICTFLSLYIYSDIFYRENKVFIAIKKKNFSLNNAKSKIIDSISVLFLLYYNYEIKITVFNDLYKNMKK